jgi:hypothetical protein
MGVMNAVHPVTALYLGPFALAFYWRWARAVGLFGWMAVMTFVLFRRRTS